MSAKRTYKLFGYIEYVKSDVGFVTPIFVDASDEYFVQVTEKINHWLVWEPLPKLYSTKISATSVDRQLLSTDTILYGFKWNEELYFGTGHEMSQYLLHDFLQVSEKDTELASAFIKDWESLEPLIEELNETNIWEKCIDYIHQSSKTLPKIFSENLKYESFNDSTLVLTAKNWNVKKVFEKQYRDDLIKFFRWRIPEFKIVVNQDFDVDLLLPHVYFGADFNNIHQGSYFIKTAIRVFQDFDNFIVGDFNLQAFEKAFSFGNKGLDNIFIVEGKAGTGKSHLLNSIAKRISDLGSSKSVAMYTVFGTAGEISKEITGIDLFEREASSNDVILIDNVDNIKTHIGLQRIIRTIRKWRDSGKVVAISSREPLDSKSLPELNDKAEVVRMNFPSDPDKYKLIRVISNELNIGFTEFQIEKFTESKELNNVTDMYKLLVRFSVMKDIGWPLPQNWKYASLGGFSKQRIRSSIHRYFFDSRNRWSHNKDVFHNDLYKDILSHFLYYVFDTEIHSDFPNSSIVSSSSHFYSIDHLHHVYLENEEFRRTISDISSSLLDVDKGKPK